MNALLKGQFGAATALLFLLSLLDATFGQLVGEDCLAQFKKGKEDFILDAAESVKDGATFISSPELNRYKDCVSACCKKPRCNVAFMERGAEEGMVKSCYLFDCLYKNDYACRFVRKDGYMSYIVDSLYENYLKVDASTDETDRPPVADGGQDRVVQPQDDVLLNGFKSKDDVAIVSYQWSMLTVYPYAVLQKTSFKDEILVSNLTSGLYNFQLTVTDGNGQSHSDKVAVLVLTQEQSTHHCMAPKKSGPCRASYPRWHYNAASEQCEEFNFGGCKENLNNYLTKDDCDKACDGYGNGGVKSGRGLPIPSDQGEKCDAPCTLEQFTCENGCCLDPGLECDQTPQCSDGSDEAKCKDLDDRFSILLLIPVNEVKVRCTELPDTGNCRDSLTKWYYDPRSTSCSRFNYGGCAGNDNRFDTEEICMRTCRTVTEKDIFARKGAFERLEGDNETAIIAVAAALGVAILILLGVLLYCCLKGKKKTTQHQRVPVNSVPVTLEDRERLVYNSTTKPI